METYVDALLRRQLAMSRAVAEENAELTELLILDEPPQKGQAEEEGGEAGGGSGSVSPLEAQTPAAELLSELSAMQERRGRIALLRQTLSEQRQRQTMQLLSVDPMQRRPENTTGGLTGSYRQTLVSDGIAGAPTERSMLEISRYFERDARRYG